MIRPKLIALALAGILTIAGSAGCTGRDSPAETSAPTNTAIVTEAPDTTPTIPPTSVVTQTSTVTIDNLLKVVAPPSPTATAAPTPTRPWPTSTPWPTLRPRPVRPEPVVIPTLTFTIVKPTPIATRVPRPTIIAIPTTRISATPTPASSLTVAEYLAWCAVNTSNDTTARVLEIDPTDFADASTVTNADMARAVGAHVEVVDSVVPPSAIERFHTAQRNWFEGLSAFYGRFPANEYVDWGSFEHNLLADTDLSWRLLTFTTALERLPDHIRNPITNNCFN